MRLMNTHDQTTRGGDGREADDGSRHVRSETTLRRIGEALQGLRYGSVLAIVQDGVVVQIERTEKTRLGK